MTTLICLLLLPTLGPRFDGAARASGPSKPKPPVWIMPPSDDGGRKFRDLFEHDPNEWKQTRSRIAGIAYADHWLNTQFTDAELSAWLPKLSRWGLKLGLEVGAIKPWGTTGEKTFGIERKMWDRFQRLGGELYSVAMDEPLSCTRESLHESRSYAVEQTAEFIALIRRNYPSMKVGDIEPYPSIPAKELLAFLDELQARLAELHVRGLDFFRVDVDWMHFVVHDEAGQEGWPGVRRLEQQCRRRHIPFSLIYWAADYPSLKQQNRATDETWEKSILRQAADYAAAGGSPDDFMIESWLDTPSQSLPETQPGTFTNSVLDFCRELRLTR